LKAGILCAPEPLKSIVLPVIVYELLPGVKVAATPIVPLLVSVRGPFGTTSQIVVVESGMVCELLPLKSIVLPVIVYEFGPGVNVRQHR